MGFWAIVVVISFIVFLASFVLLLLYVLGQLYKKYVDKKAKNPFSPYVSILMTTYFAGFLFLLIGSITASLTHDPFGNPYIDAVFNLAQQNIGVAVLLFGGYATFIWTKVTKLFDLLDDPKDGVHHRITQIETKTSGIEKSVDEIKTDVKYLRDNIK